MARPPLASSQGEKPRHRLTTTASIGIILFIGINVFCFWSSKTASIAMTQQIVLSFSNAPALTHSQEQVPPLVAKDNRSVSYLTKSDLFHPNDAYAASWWQSTERFQRTRVHAIGFLEDAVFRAFNVDQQDIRLTRDWMDLGVEHMSKWWSIARVRESNASFTLLMRNLMNYILQRKPQDSPNNPFKDTIAVIAYVPIDKSDRMKPLDAVVLGSTLASLMTYHVGRIVVVTDVEDLEHTQRHVWPKMIKMLQEARPLNATSATWQDVWHQIQFSPESPERRIGSTDLVLTAVPSRYANGKDKKLVPRACLILLHEAMFGGGDWTIEQRRMVVGESLDRWKYVYYSEQDSPLFTRPHAVSQFRDTLDRGALLVPHRWQPAPHAHDFVETSKDLSRDSYLPAVGNWTRITLLDESSACCDLGAQSRHGRISYPHPGNFWYMAGFHRRIDPKEKDPDRVMAERLVRYSTYSLVRLKGGTGLTLAGSESARQCSPNQVHLESCPIPV